MNLKEEMFGTFTAEAGQLFGMQILLMKESTEPDQIYLWAAQKYRVDYIFNYDKDSFLRLNKADCCIEQVKFDNEMSQNLIKKLPDCVFQKHGVSCEVFCDEIYLTCADGLLILDLAG